MCREPGQARGQVLSVAFHKGSMMRPNSVKAWIHEQYSDMASNYSTVEQIVALQPLQSMVD